MSSRRPCPPQLLPRAARLCAALFLGLVAPGCHDEPRPWEGKPGPAVVLSAAPPHPAATIGTGELADADAGQGDGDAGARTDLDLPVLPVRVGGPWVRCYGNFRISGDPLKDVTRLSLLCGPENGMRRISPKPIEGQVAEGGAIVTEKLQAVRGACYRVFAVGGPGVLNLDVAVRSSRGAMIASDGTEDAWPIVQPDRPFCPLEDDDATVEISARRGNGRFAAEVWMLKSYKRARQGDAGTEAGEDETYEMNNETDTYEEL
ncbi:hypothetical protein [Sorangium atrum]|uniref:Lipoprotein n=1 Tax=Sorangium atrum TaxID=2995308 RepID=A0ABT5C998_9BACT|nr:hypothetical protein [Sorangium aterium]MDC0682178.1 hypothetical protein [Sorangium aterium]